MDTAAIDAKIVVVLNKAKDLLQTLTPIDTGNMRYNGVRLMPMGPGHWRLIVDENLAPYVPYTNEKWISPKWRGKKNPNENWWNEAIEKVILLIAADLGGSFKKE